MVQKLTRINMDYSRGPNVSRGALRCISFWRDGALAG